jgi:hypothetical protein
VADREHKEKIIREMDSENATKIARLEQSLQEEKKRVACRNNVYVRAATLITNCEAKDSVISQQAAEIDSRKQRIREMNKTAASTQSALRHEPPMENYSGQANTGILAHRR